MSSPIIRQTVCLGSCATGNAWYTPMPRVSFRTADHARPSASATRSCSKHASVASAIGADSVSYPAIGTSYVVVVAAELTTTRDPASTTGKPTLQ